MTLVSPWVLSRYVFTHWICRKGEGTFLAEEGACAQAGGKEGLQAFRSGGEGTAGDEARKVGKHQTKEERLQICV